MLCLTCTRGLIKPCSVLLYYSSFNSTHQTASITIRSYITTVLVYGYFGTPTGAISWPLASLEVVEWTVLNSTVCNIMGQLLIKTNHFHYISVYLLATWLKTTWSMTDMDIYQEIIADWWGSQMMTASIHASVHLSAWKPHNLREEGICWGHGLGSMSILPLDERICFTYNKAIKKYVSVSCVRIDFGFI